MSTGIEKRLQFMSMDDKTIAALTSLRPAIQANLQDALDTFYAKVRSTPETRAFFKDEKQIDGAKRRQAEHWSRLFSGQFDDGYAKAVRSIGHTHARIGLAPQWYIGGYALIAEHIIKTVMKEKLGTVAKRIRTNPVELGDAFAAMIKAVLLDMEMAISIYIEVLDEKRKEVEDAKEKEAQHQSSALRLLAECLEKMAAGDLTKRLSEEVAPQFDAMEDNYNAAAETLDNAIRTIFEASERIENGNCEIARAADDLASRTERQAAALEETTAAVEHLTSRVATTSSGANNARTIVSKVTEEAHDATSVLDGMKASIAAIEQSTSEISTITETMDEIAFQTNLLALNAGVEAARAGESGRGFAVIASEVRSLAQRAAESAKLIKTLVQSATGRVNEGVKFAGRTDETVRDILGQFLKINTVIGDIAGAAREQAQGISEVNIAISEMDSSTQQNAAMVEETTAATHTVAKDAHDLAESVRFFKVSKNRSGQTSSASMPVARSAMKQRSSAMRKPEPSHDWQDF